MRLAPRLVWACLLLLGAGAAVAEGPGHAAVVVKVAPVTVAPGGRAESTITLEIQKGFRIIASGTSSMRYTQPVLLAFDAADGVFVEPAVWPAGKSWRAEPEDPEVKVYEGRLDLKVVVRAAPETPRQEIALQGRLRYQAIQWNAFQKTAVMPLSMPVTIAAPPGKAPAAGGATRP